MEKGRERNVGNAALVAMTPKGAIRAMAHAGRDGHSFFSRFVNSKRQPGSAFKSFVYLSALQAGKSPSSRVLDHPDGGWPENFDNRYRGHTDLQTAFSESLNAASVNLAREIGVDEVVRAAEQLGITSSLREFGSIALGTSEVGQVELAAAYAAFANGGHRVTPHAVALVLGPWGIVIYEYAESSGEQVIGPKALSGIRHLLRAAVVDGTGRNAAFDEEVFGKTGTTQGFRDALFLGFTEMLVTAVWLGNDDNGPTHSVTGGTLPAEAFRRFNATIYDDEKSETWLARQSPAATLPVVMEILTSKVGIALLLLTLVGASTFRLRLSAVSMLQVGVAALLLAWV